MQFQSSNSSAAANQGKQQSQRNRNNQGAKNKQDKQPQPAQQPVDWGNLYAPKQNEQKKPLGNSDTNMSSQKNQNFKEFVPGTPKQAKAPKNEMNELEMMMSESANASKKGDHRGQKADTNVDDAILSIDTSAGTSKPPTFSNKNKPKNTKDANFALQLRNQDQKKTPGGKKERQLTKTHASWVTGDQGESLNELMKTEGGTYDQFADKNTTYDESLYNTTYDIKKFSKKQIDHAYQIEKEIMGKDAKGNIHLAEERGQIQLRDNENEEIMYSGVIRNKAAKLNNPKKFTCFRKNAIPFKQDQMKKSFVGGLLSADLWQSFELKGDQSQNQSSSTQKQYSQNKYQNNYSQGQTQKPAYANYEQKSKIENSVTGVYKGGGSQQISNTQNAYIKQQVTQNTFQPKAAATPVPAQTSSLKLPSTSFVPNAQPFVPKSMQNVQSFQPKEEIKTTSPPFMPNQSFTPKNEAPKFNEFKPNNQFQSFNPTSQYNDQQQTSNYSNSSYQPRQNNHYQQQSSLNSYQGNNYKQDYQQDYKQNYSNGNTQDYKQSYNNSGNQNYQQKHQNNYQNYQQQNYQGNQAQNSTYGQNKGYTQQNQQYRPVNNSGYNQGGMQQQQQNQSQQQWGSGNLYHMNQNAFVNTQQHDQYNQNQIYNQTRQAINNNYNQSHGSQASNVNSSGGFQNNNGMKIGANAFKPNSS